MSHLQLCLCVDKPNVAIRPSEHSEKIMSGTDPIESYRLKRTQFLEKAADYEAITVIGNGTFGLAKIYAACHKPTQTYIALRKVNLDTPNIEQLEYIKHEVHVWRFLFHPNILTLYSTFVHKRDLWMITHFAAYGSCADLIQANFTDGLQELAVAFILREVLQALEYIHEMKYIHRAVKGSHILIDADGAVFLSGLGVSLRMGQTQPVAYDFPSKAVQVLHWMAPEILEQNIAGYDNKVDIYSLGITAIELATGTVPYNGMAPTQILLNKLHGVPPFLNGPKDVSENLTTGTDSGFGSSVAAGTECSGKSTKQFSPSLCQVVNSCLQSDPRERPSASVLLSYQFFKQIRKRAKEDLPEILQPVHPLTDFQHEEGQEGIVNVTEELADIEIEDWNF